MNDKQFTMVQRLTDYANFYKNDHVFGRLAYYFLINYNNLESLSLKDVAKDCFVSISTVSRFCKMIGYDNYSDFVNYKYLNKKNQRNIAIYNLQKKRYQDYNLRQEINNAFYSVSRSLSNESMAKLIENIKSADYILFFCVRPYNIWLREFQNQFIALGKPVYIFDSINMWKDTICRLSNNICNIVISPAAKIIEPVRFDLDSLNGSKTLIACNKIEVENYKKSDIGRYDDIILLNTPKHDYNYLELYGKYVISYFFDILIGEYIKSTINSDDYLDLNDKNLNEDV